MRGELIAALCLTSSAAAQTKATAFVDVTVIATKTGKLAEHQTVIVDGGRIVSVGPANEAKAPAGATRIEGGYLLPGFADLHTHPGRTSDLATYVANGITTIRVMWGDRATLRWRAQADAGRLWSPRIVTAGAIIDGNPPSQPTMKVITDARLARTEVTAQHRAGFDFIKVYNSVPAAVYDSIVAVAGELKMPIAGHVPFEVGLNGVLRAHQASIEHLRGYVAELVPKDAPVQPGATLRSRSVAWNYIDPARLPALVERTKAAGVWNVPTVVVAIDMVPSTELAAVMRRPEVKYLDPSDIPDRSKISYLADFADSDYVATQKGVARQLEVVAALYRGGAGLLIGTDSWLQGFAYQDELEFFERAGLSRREVLDLATRAASLFWHQEGQWGEVAAGQRADLQLLEKNPLESLGNLKSRRGVMLRGRWRSASQLIEAMERGH